MIRGVNGFVMWGFYRAATIEGYTVTHDKTSKQTILSARLILTDKFRLAQRPLTFEAPYQGGKWICPILTARIDKDRLTATLGPEMRETWDHVSSGQTHAH